MTYEVRNKEIEKLLKNLGNDIKDLCPPGWGFGLFIFEYGGEAMFYISSANREDMIKALREFIQKQEVQ